MAKRPKPPLERIARALCCNDNLPENTQFEGRAMWKSFLPQARSVLLALLDEADDDERRVIERWLG